MRPVLALSLAVSLLATGGCASTQASAKAAPGGADYISCAWPQPPAKQAMARHGKAAPDGQPAAAPAK